MISLNEYMLRNKKMQEFLRRLAEIEGSEISFTDPESYIGQLRWLKVETIGELARRTLEGSELDILSSNSALRFLCRAELVTGGYSENQAAEFIELSVSKKERAKRQANYLFEMYADIKGED